MLTLYKKQDGQTLLLAGHFNKAELQAYKRQGYRMRDPNVNKHGIPVARRKRLAKAN